MSVSPRAEPLVEEEKVRPNPELNQFMQHEKNPKKRKRSPSQASGLTGMTLRPRGKQRRLNDDVSDNGGDDVVGASFIRYEVVERRGKQCLMPVRYSIRRGGTRTEDLERLILNHELEYIPSEMEALLPLDASAVEVKRLLDLQMQAERQKMQVGDVKTIVLFNEDFALVKVTKEAREAKYNGCAHVAVPLPWEARRGRPRRRPVDEAELMKEVVVHMVATSKALAVRVIRSGIFTTQASEDTLKYIQENKPSAPVTRAAAASKK